MNIKARVALVVLVIVTLVSANVSSASAEENTYSSPTLSAQEQLILERIAALPETATEPDLFAALGVAGGQAPEWAIDEAHPEGWLDVLRCTGAIGLFIATNAFLITKIAKIGGIIAVAKILLAAKNWSQRWQAAVAFFGDITGLTGVITACGG